MRLAALAAVVAVLDVFLRVVPRAAAAGHRDAHEEARDDAADEHAAEDFCPVGNRRDGEDGCDRDERGDDHFLERSLRDDVHTRAVVGRVLTGEDAGQRLDLAAHFGDDGTRRATDGAHAECAEKIRKQAADEEADHHLGIVQREAERVGDLRFQRDERIAGDTRERVLEVILQIHKVAAEEHDCGEARAGDRVAFRHGLHRVADGVEFVRRLAHFGREAAHHGDAACVVSDGPERIERDDDAGHREHGHDCDGDAVEPGKCVGAPNSSTDAKHHRRGGLLADGEAGDDVRAVAGLGGLGDFPHRPVGGACVVIGDEHGDARHYEAHDAREENALRGQRRAFFHREARGENPIRERIKRRRRNHAADEHAAHECGAGLASVAVHKKHADDARDDRDSAEEKRIHDRRRTRASRRGERADEHRADERHGVCFKNIRGHSRAVAHVVADVVRDGRGIARIVLRKIVLHFAHEVRADIRGLRVDAAAEPREDRDERCAEREADEARDRLAGHQLFHDEVEATGREQRERDDEQARDCTAAECRLQCLLRAGARAFRGADIGLHRDAHPDESGSERAHGTYDETDRSRHVFFPKQQRGDRDADHGNRDKLSAEVRLRALLDGIRDELHFFRAG